MARDPILLSASPSAGQVRLKEAEFKARRVRDQMHGRNTAKESAGLVLEEGMRRNVFIDILEGSSSHFANHIHHRAQ